MRKASWVVLVVVLAIASFSADTMAQDIAATAETVTAATGSIRGTVTKVDSERFPIRDAHIEWIGIGGKKGLVKSDGDGNYQIKDLKPGQYALNVYHEAFSPRKDLVVFVVAGNETLFDIRLRPDGRVPDVAVSTGTATAPSDTAVPVEAEGHVSAEEIEQRVNTLRRRMGREAAAAEPRRRPEAQRSRYQLKVYDFEHVSPEHAMLIVKPFVGERGIVVGDDRSGKLFVKADGVSLKDVEEVLKHIDVPERRRAVKRDADRPRTERRDQDKRMGSAEKRVLPLSIWPTDKGVQLLHKERPVTQKQLIERLGHLDDPHGWMLRIHVHPEVSDGAYAEIMEMVKHAAREYGIEKVDAQVIKRRAKPKEAPMLRVLLRPSEKAEAGFEMLHKERPISLEQLQKAVKELDDPHAWTLTVFIKQGIEKEALSRALDQIETVVRENGIEKIKLED